MLRKFIFPEHYFYNPVLVFLFNKHYLCRSKFSILHHMFIASRKKKENIAEYLLYMWQIEDIIRANHLKIESIRENIIDKFDCSSDEKKQMYEWYESLIDMMRLENKQFQGHIQLLQNVIIDLTDLHLRLLQSHKEPDYKMAYYKVLPFIMELRNKNKDGEQPEIEICFSAL